ncbi:MAG: manganese efflux pump MntP family protein [Candidatus Sericytochromatia bacterium]
MPQLDALSLTALSVGLAMDAFAVAITMGATMRKMRPTQMARLALAFGGFQGLMPVVGYLAARSLAEHAWVPAADHWIAFGLLAFLGGKMIYEARFLGDSDDDDDEYSETDPTKSGTLILLALATSIDALAVGASLAFLRVTIIMPSLVIGVTAAIFAMLGAELGQRIGKRWGKRVEIAGGLALIAIGFRILIEHLMHPVATGLQAVGLPF